MDLGPRSFEIAVHGGDIRIKRHVDEFESVVQAGSRCAKPGIYVRADINETGDIIFYDNNFFESRQAAFYVVVARGYERVRLAAEPLEELHVRLGVRGFLRRCVGWDPFYVEDRVRVAFFPLHEGVDMADSR